MLKLTVAFAFLYIYISGLTCASSKQEVNIETNSEDPFITKMYAKEIEDGDNAELPLERGHNKHHKGKKKHLHGALNRGYYGRNHGGYNLGLLNHHHLSHQVPIGLPIENCPGVPHGYGIPYNTNHIPHHHVRIGHAPELPIIHPPLHHHGMHHPHFPEYMPFPYPLPMCVIEKDDEKKKDDKKEGEKKKEKKSKRQLVPCHFSGPFSAGWGAFLPGYTGNGWGYPTWY